VARVLGADIEDSLASAVSLELLHNALLIHDDIEDESEERRGQPTLHQKHGVPIAINVGDSLSLMSLRPLLDNQHRLGHQATLWILQETMRMARESAEGQALELGWRRDNDCGVDQSDYFRMILKKTCWLAVIHPLRLGAIIGGRRPLDDDDFVRLGFLIGAAFQIQDDVLNLVGDSSVYGKEIAGDLWEGKRTLILARLFEVATAADRSTAAAVLGKPRQQKTQLEIDLLSRLLRRYDCVEYAQVVARGFAEAATVEFDRVFRGAPKSRDLVFLRDLPSWAMERRS